MNNQKRIQVKDLKTDQIVGLQPFAISDLKVSQTKAGKDFASFKVSDKSGTMNAVWWDYGLQNAAIQDMLKNKFLCVGGVITQFNNVLQMKVDTISPAENVHVPDFEKCSKYDPEFMWNQFLEFVNGFESKEIQTVVTELVDKYGERFKLSAAATGLHHAFKHGLIEHTLQMLQTADELLKLPFYKEVLNRDIVIFGIMFHDFGKIFEYGPPPDFKKTTQGAKVPHIPKMSNEIAKACDRNFIPEALEDELCAIVLSHHRKIEWGSPVSFSSAEAAFVHYIDNLHGDVFGIVQRVESDTSSDLMVKHGYGTDSYTIVKKTPGQVIKEAADGKFGF